MKGYTLFRAPNGSILMFPTAHEDKVFKMLEEEWLDVGPAYGASPEPKGKGRVEIIGRI